MKINRKYEKTDKIEEVTTILNTDCNSNNDNNNNNNSWKIGTIVTCDRQLMQLFYESQEPIFVHGPDSVWRLKVLAEDIMLAYPSL